MVIDSFFVLSVTVVSDACGCAQAVNDTAANSVENMDAIAFMLSLTYKVPALVLDRQQILTIDGDFALAVLPRRRGEHGGN